MTGTPPRDGFTLGQVPVAWSAERETRGRSATAQTPRCTERGCPVRYASGPDRLCREHRREADDDDPVPAPAGQDGLVRQELLADYHRSNVVIAGVCGVSHTSVARARRMMEAAGVIPRFRDPGGNPGWRKAVS